MDALLAFTDLTERSRNALLRARQLAAEHGARLIVLNASEDPDAPLLDERMDGWPPEGTEAELLLRRGRPFVEIVRAARERAVDLVVLGALAASPLSDFLIGGTAERVLRKGDRPVLVVRLPPAGPYRRVLVATDFSETARRAAEAAAALFPTAELELIHVVDPLAEGRLLRLGAAEAEVARLRAESRERALAGLEALRARLPPAAPIRLTVERGRPHAAVASIAERREAELLVVGTHGRTQLAYAMLGSVAENVIREATCDVLAVRPEGFRFELP